MPSEYDALLEQPPTQTRSEYDALLEQPSKGGVGQALENAGAAALNVAKGFVKGFLPKFDTKSLAEIAFAPAAVASQTMQMAEGAIDAVKQVGEAEKTPAFSRERFEAGFNVAGQLAMIAGLKGGVEAAYRPTPLMDVFKGKVSEAPVTDIAKEVTDNAVKERNIQESVQPKRAGDGEVGTPSQTSGGSSIQPEAQVPAQTPQVAPVPQPEQPRILSTAVQREGQIFQGQNPTDMHVDIGEQHGLGVPAESERGFIVQEPSGATRLVGREEGGKVADQTGQRPAQFSGQPLTSEHLQGREPEVKPTEIRTNPVSAFIDSGGYSVSQASVDRAYSEYPDRPEGWTQERYDIFIRQRSSALEAQVRRNEDSYRREYIQEHGTEPPTTNKPSPVSQVAESTNIHEGQKIVVSNEPQVSGKVPEQIGKSSQIQSPVGKATEIVLEPPGSVLAKLSFGDEKKVGEISSFTSRTTKRGKKYNFSLSEYDLPDGRKRFTLSAGGELVDAAALVKLTPEGPEIQMLHAGQTGFEGLGGTLAKEITKRYGKPIVDEGSPLSPATSRYATSGQQREVSTTADIKPKPEGGVSEKEVQVQGQGGQEVLRNVPPEQRIIPEKLPQDITWEQIHQKAEYVRKLNPNHLVTVSPSTTKEGWSRINYWDQGGIVSHLEVPDERLDSVLQKETYPRGAKIISVEGGIGGTYPSADYAGMGFRPDVTAAKGIKTFVGPADSVDWMKGRLESGGYKVSVKDVPEPPKPSPVPKANVSNIAQPLPQKGEGGGGVQPPAAPPEVVPEPEPQPTGGVSAAAMEQRPIEAPPPGTGVGWEQTREFGNKWLDSGGDINKVMADFKRTGKLDEWEVGKGAAYLERLQSVTNRAADSLRDNPNDPALQQAYTEAKAKEQRFSDEFKPMATVGSNVLKGFQGKVPLTDDMADSYTALTRKFGEVKGREVTPEEAVRANKLAKQNAKAKTDYQAANQELMRRADVEYGRIKTTRKGPPTLESLGKAFGQALKEVCDV